MSTHVVNEFMHYRIAPTTSSHRLIDVVEEGEIAVA
jgi:hypothetical protein